MEVLQASICLFSALSDAHRLGIGIVDLKLENFLVITIKVYIALILNILTSSNTNRSTLLVQVG